MSRGAPTFTNDDHLETLCAILGVGPRPAPELGLRPLVGWLRRLADASEARGADVQDIRKAIVHFEGELRRRVLRVVP